MKAMTKLIANELERVVQLLTRQEERLGRLESEQSLNQGLLDTVINMDGVEWRRQKWGGVAKAWFWINDWAGCWLGNHLVADHPEIKKHLATRVSASKITMIPYGSDRVDAADHSLIAPYGLTPDSYAILIARAEPENSILEVVRAWSRQPRGCKLVVLGRYFPDHVYQRAVQAAASEEVTFPGAIYEKPVVQALRFHARFYVHGHQVGGTNPSLVEALGAGNAVLAHDNFGKLSVPCENGRAGQDL